MENSSAEMSPAESSNGTLQAQHRQQGGEGAGWAAVRHSSIPREGDQLPNIRALMDCSSYLREGHQGGITSSPTGACHMSDWV